MNPILRKGVPRLPLDGNLDLTYRCNNNCRHCWLWLPEDAPQRKHELSFDEIRRVVDEARKMGCQAWAISGGEPMLRPDFPDIFEYLTRKAVHYSLNTNGTLITPEIARLLARRGRKMVALYGATAEVHDFVTRTPGSFEATRRGFAYLQEAGAGFEVQIVPMRANYHQYEDMLALAQSLSPRYRIGAAWLFLSAARSAARNREILRQRLHPAEVISLDTPNPIPGLVGPGTQSDPENGHAPCGAPRADNRLFANCIASRRDFHLDPYGGISFCYYIKDPALRFNLRQGTFQRAWDEFIPSLAGSVRGGQEYFQNCGSCERRQDCRWCPVFGYLEHGRYDARVEYLCQAAEHTRRYKQDYQRDHLRYYKIAGITIQVAADFPLTDSTFHPKFEPFWVDGPGSDTISIRLVSRVPSRKELKLGEEIYRRPPWAIYKRKDAFTYLGITSHDDSSDPYSVAIFNSDHSRSIIHIRNELHKLHRLHSLTSFPSDQILLARILSYRQGCYLHASGIIIAGHGLLFVGHSGAGKSTIIKLLRGHGEILCDERIILRRWSEGFKIHGTWSHGELPDVSPAGAPLKAILYLEKAGTNQLIPITDKRERLGKVLSHVVRPLVTTDWWENTLDLSGKVATEVPAYRLRFDKSGEVVDLLKQL